MKTIFAAIAAATLATAAPALAQMGPGGVPVGAGLQRGVEELNTSGQTGFVTLFDRGSSTNIVTAIDGAGGRVEGVAIQRGKGCDTIQPGLVARSADLAHGISRGTVPLSEDRLLSGNYVVVVYSTSTTGGRQVACGQLYR
jgi:hypothetical protein